MKKHWILGLLLFPLLTQAQRETVSIYPIPDQEIKQVLIGKKKGFDPYQLAKPFKVVEGTKIKYAQTFNDSIPRGYYLISKLADRTEEFSYYHHTDFGALTLHSLHEERYFHIQNKSFTSDSLLVKVDDERLRYDATLGMFRLGERQKSGVLSISSPTETIYMLFETEKQKLILLSEVNSITQKTLFTAQYDRRKEWRGLLGFGLKKWYLSEKTQGYIVLSQPMYRQGDSLKLKAYLLDGNGKGLAQTLSLQIHPQGQDDDKKELKKIRPQSSGLYLFDTVLADSLQLDQNYYLSLNDLAGNELMRNYFRLEDYLLDEYEFSFFLSSSTNLLSDSVGFIISAQTTNGLPVPDINVQLKGSISDIFELADNPIYIANTLIDTNLNLPYSGSLLLKIPATRFPAIDADYTFNANFVGANGESVTKSVYLQRRKPSKTKSPAKPNLKRPRIELGGKQTQDSTHLFVHNPTKEKLVYRIYRQHDLVTEGISQDSIHWHWEQSGEAFWRLQVQDQKTNRVYKYSLTPSEHFIKIDLEQPDTIKPGQIVEAKIRLTDHQGQPIADTDLSVWGVNAQFRRENIPDLPYLGPQLLSREAETILKPSFPNKYAFENSLSLNQKRVKQLRLLNDPYYQQYFPDSIHLHYEAIPDTSVAMYAAFVFDSLGHQHKIHFIWQDSVIKYYAEANRGNPYCLVSQEGGQVALDIRLSNKLLHLPSVALKKGYKLTLSLNYHQLPKSISEEDRPYMLTQGEARLINRYFPRIQLCFDENIGYLWQNGWSYPIRVEGSQPMRVGPFSKDSIYLLHPANFGVKIDWEQDQLHIADRWETRFFSQNPVKAGLGLKEAQMDQKIGGSLISIDSLDFNQSPYFKSAVPDTEYEPDLYIPSLQLDDTGLCILHLDKGNRKLKALILASEDDSLNRYVKYPNPAHTTWHLPPGQFQLTAIYEDSLIIRYDDIQIKEDSLWLFSLTQLQGDTLPKDQWISRADFKFNYRKHPAWAEPLTVNYSTANLGTADIKFRLVDTFGAAIPKARIWSQDGMGNQELQISDKDGQVHFRHLRSHNHSFSIYHPDYRYLRFDYKKTDSLIVMKSMPASHLKVWQQSLHAPHLVSKTYRNAKNYVVEFEGPPRPYLPNPSMFYQDTIRPINHSFALDSNLLPYFPKATPAKRIRPDFPTFEPTKKPISWGLHLGAGSSRMNSILDHNQAYLATFGLWMQIAPQLKLNLHQSLERQLVSSNSGPTTALSTSPWRNWYEPPSFLYPAIQRDRWTSALQLQYDLLQSYSSKPWRFALGIGLGLSGGRIFADASRNALYYDYTDISLLDQASPPLSNDDRRDMLQSMRDEIYETNIPLAQSFQAFAMTSAQLSYRFAARFELVAQYHLQLSGANNWDSGLSTIDASGGLAADQQARRWYQHFGFGLNFNLTKKTASLWWQNPLDATYAEVSEGEYLYLYDEDSDGVPDLYEKEYNSPVALYYDAKRESVELPGLEKLEERLAPEENMESLEKALRQDFRDAAFWEPNLKTDHKGEARFTIQYPDDITAWHCYVIAMNENRQVGYLKDTVKAQAPLFARLDLPLSLRVGDQLDMQGRVQSLTREKQQIFTRFMVEDSLFEERSVTLEEYWKESQSVSFADTGSYQIAYMLRDSSGFTEGEARKLGVIENTVKEQKGSFVYLEGDSSLSMPSGFAASQNVQLIAYHQPIDFLQARLAWLYRYPYGCNEQLASRLIGLHLQQMITTAPDSLEQLKRKEAQVFRNLLKAQNKDGSWGWWGGNQGDQWMSLYVLEALDLVKPNDKAVAKGQAWLVQAFREAVNKEETPSLKLAHYLLQNQLIEKDAYQLPMLDTLNRPVSVFERLLHLAIQYEQGEQLEVADILSLSKRDVLGGRYWASRGWRWYGSQIESTVLAYELVQHIEPNHAALAQIRQFLLLADDAWQNQTVETARMLQILISEQGLTHASGLGASPKMQLTYAGDSRLYDRFPIQLDVPPTGVQIRKQGSGPLLLSFSQTQQLVDASVVDSLFEIKTIMIEGEHKLDSLKKGESFILEVEVLVKYRADHLMLEVPIPSGCTYSEKPQPYGEAYREYRRDRTNIYIKELMPGRYVYRIPLESRFTGSFQLMPARMELMYVPTQFGRNATKGVKIID